MKPLRFICSQCATVQARGVSTDYCSACGVRVRDEARCVWCARWVPVGKFCRECGCVQVDSAHYGAARMLKALGVDQLSLALRLGAMDPEQLETYSRLYMRHLNAVSKRSEEAGVCQSFLVNQEFDLALEEELNPRIPFDDANLSLLDGGPQGPFTPELKTLHVIAVQSPIPNNRLLATLALIRTGAYPYGSAPWRDAWRTVGTCLCAETPLAVEAALLHGHWRITHGTTQLRVGLPLSAQQFALVALVHPMYRLWAAVTLASYSIQCDESVRSQIDDLVEKALTTDDPDLALSAAATRGVPALLVRELKAQDTTRGFAAALALARLGAADLVPFLERAADEILLALVRAAPAPAPPGPARAVPERRRTPGMGCTFSRTPSLTPNPTSRSTTRAMPRTSGSRRRRPPFSSQTVGMSKTSTTCPSMPRTPTAPVSPGSIPATNTA